MSKSLIDELQQAVTDAAERVGPSVVGLGRGFGRDRMKCGAQLACRRFPNHRGNLFLRGIANPVQASEMPQQFSRGLLTNAGYARNIINRVTP